MPASELPHIQAYADDTQTMHCMKCEKALHAKDVAMFIRTNPEDAFSPWCPTCTWEIIHAAATQLLGPHKGSVAALF